MKISLTTGEPDGDIILSLADFSLILGPEVHLETCWLHLLLYIKPESSHREKKKGEIIGTIWCSNLQGLI